jgi:hypothetical protein
MLTTRSFRYLVASCALIAAVVALAATPASASTNPVNKCVACPVKQAPPPAPQNLRVTHDYHECLAHIGNFNPPFENDSVFCDGWNNGKNFHSALIWDPGAKWFSLYVDGTRILYYQSGPPLPCCVWPNKIANGGCAFVRAINVNQPDTGFNWPTDTSKYIESANSNTVCNHVVNPMRPLVPAPQSSH